MARESAFGRLIRHFHEHPQGRLHEFLFWAGLGVVLGIGTWFGWRGGQLSTPIALMLAVVSICFLGWALLPRPRNRAPAPLPRGKRGEIQKRVRESKQETKKKKGGDVPPGPPIRRG